MNQIPFAQKYRAPKGGDCYEHRILNIVSQSLKFNEKSIMTQNIAVQYIFYVGQAVSDHAII